MNALSDQLLADFRAAMDESERDDSVRAMMVVQAWRALDWPPDHYSIAIFEFNAVDGGTKLDFTQIGVPAHRYEGHCHGWTQTYWTPMKEILEQGSTSVQTRANVEAARQRIQAGNP
jgi:hypothetical protein